MKKLVMAIVLAAMSLMVFGSVALAAGPAPGQGNNPWIDAIAACVTNNGSPGHLLMNTKSSQFHCFAD